MAFRMYVERDRKFPGKLAITHFLGDREIAHSDAMQS